jgi:hypothetical protein
MQNLAVYVLAILAARNYGWLMADAAARGAVSKALGAVAILALLLLVYRLAPYKPLGLAVAYGAFEELQTVICSTAYAFNPWTVPEGQSICSARIDFDLGALGVMLLAAALHRISQPVNPDRSQNSESNAP